MTTYFCRLIPPRPSFAQDLDAEEARLMGEHAAYWREWMRKGKVVAFGVVADPAGAYGIGIIEVTDEAEARSLTAGDPTIVSGRGFRHELHLMPRGAVHPPAAGAA